MAKGFDILKKLLGEEINDEIQVPPKKFEIRGTPEPLIKGEVLLSFFQDKSKRRKKRNKIKRKKCSLNLIRGWRGCAQKRTKR